eukprot:2530284-Amphidinium_carterae.1
MLLRDIQYGPRKSLAVEVPGLHIPNPLTDRHKDNVVGNGVSELLLARGVNLHMPEVCKCCITSSTKLRYPSAQRCTRRFSHGPFSWQSKVLLKVRRLAPLSACNSGMCRMKRV